MTLAASEFVNKVTVADGAWGTELDKLGCPAGFCRERWNLEKPELVQQVADAYINAGSQIIITNTFGANRFVLDGHGLATEVSEFNRAGADISKRAAGDKAYVFGSIGPSGKIVMTGEITEDQVYEAFKEQAEGLAAGGADALVVETMSETTEATAAVRAAKTTGLLVAACMTYDSGKDHTCTMMGVTPEQAAESLTAAGADIIGCNCGIGIENYIVVAGMLRKITDIPIWVKANAGMPEVRGAEIVYNMKPEEFATKVHDLIAAGANIVGGCCGTSPAFIEAIVKSLK
jgi:methionine synthase I (cobalamin-dependent)